MPKALVDTGDGPWVQRAVALVAGCQWRLVVVGADADRVATVLPPGVTVVPNPEFATGMASSVRAGLQALPADADAVLLTLVDLPDLTSAVAERVLAAAGSQVSRALLRASFAGRPGHPVLIGRAHLAGVLASLVDPDSGAGRYLTEHGALSVECGDLATGADRDVPD